MGQVGWRIRGRVRAYRHRVDMMRRQGDLAYVEEGLLLLAVGSLLGLFCIGLGAVRLGW